jgi:hypothetical protein
MINPLHVHYASAFYTKDSANEIMYVKACSIKGEVKNIFLPPPEARIKSAIPALSPMSGAFGFGPRHC